MSVSLGDQHRYSSSNFGILTVVDADDGVRVVDPVVVIR